MTALLSPAAALEKISGASRRNRPGIARRLAQDIPDGAFVNLGIGLPVLVADHLPADREIVLQSENGVLGMGRRRPKAKRFRT